LWPWTKLSVHNLLPPYPKCRVQVLKPQLENIQPRVRFNEASLSIDVNNTKITTNTNDDSLNNKRWHIIIIMYLHKNFPNKKWNILYDKSNGSFYEKKHVKYVLFYPHPFPSKMRSLLLQCSYWHFWQANFALQMVWPP